MEVMSEQFEEVLSQLHAEVNEHLGILHSLHHKQQILNIELVIGQVVDKVQCNRHNKELGQLMDIIINNLVKSDLTIIIKAFTEFLQIEVDDTCIKLIQPIQSHIMTYLKLLNQETTSFKEKIQYTDLSSIDISTAYKSIIDPLSNQKRLEIMLAIHNKHTRFKELEGVLQLQAGHLIYHLNPLREGNYVGQDNQKNYLLTEKGTAVLEMIKYLYETYTK